MKCNYANGTFESFILKELATSKNIRERLSQLTYNRTNGWWAAVHGLHRSEIVHKVNTIKFLPFGEKEFALDLIWIIKLASLGPFIGSDKILFEKMYAVDTLSASWQHNLKNYAALHFSIFELVVRLPIPKQEKIMILKNIANKIIKGLVRKLTAIQFKK